MLCWLPRSLRCVLAEDASTSVGMTALRGPRAKRIGRLVMMRKVERSVRERGVLPAGSRRYRASVLELVMTGFYVWLGELGDRFVCGMGRPQA